MKPLRDLYARWRARRAWRRIPGIPGPVHPDDHMLSALESDPPAPDDPAIVAYVGAGLSAVEALERALEREGRGWSDVRRCLDLGCGSGRVTRWLAERLEPDAVLTACDVHPVYATFCARAFGARPLVAVPESSGAAGSRAVTTDYGRHDLVWAGSVITHLPAAVGTRLVERVVRSLEPGGLFVVSFHGEFSLGVLGHYYGGVYADEAEAIRREVAEQGVSYRRYRHLGRFQGDDYGMTWHAGDWLREAVAGLDVAADVVAVEPQGWHGHHDVLTIRRTG